MKEVRIIGSVLIIAVISLFGWITLTHIVEEFGLKGDKVWMFGMLLFIFALLFLLSLAGKKKEKYECPYCGEIMEHDELIESLNRGEVIPNCSNCKRS